MGSHCGNFNRRQEAVEPNSLGHRFEDRGARATRSMASLWLPVQRRLHSLEQAIFDDDVPTF